MIRIRSKKLLSGVSTLAVMAAFGAANPALAGQTITSATNPNAPVTNAVPDDFIDVQAGSFVTADGQGRSIINTAALNAAAQAGIRVDAAQLAGSIWNSAFITPTTGDGILVSGGSLISSGGIFNSSTITGAGAGSDGIEINGSIVVGGITNSGASSVISGAANGILLTGATVFNGSITNDGNITGTAGSGILANNAGVVFLGDITNNQGATITGNGGGNAGIDLQTFNVVVGNIVNGGTIQGLGAANTGINIGTGTFVGSILNSGAILAPGAGGWGVNLEAGANFVGDIRNDAGATITSAIGIRNAGTLTGEIQNDGTVESTTAGGVAFWNLGTITGGIDNTGTMRANTGASWGILSTGSVSGGIENAGSILATGAGGQAIAITGGTFAGGIQNLGAASLIQADGTAILISIATFDGGIENSGVISSANGAGVSATVATLTGDIVNNADALINGGGGAGITWSGTDFTGSVLNDGAITASNQGIIMTATGTIAGDVTNNGDITGSQGIVLTALLIDGSVTNTGAINSTGNGINLNGVVTGGVTNDGDISASTFGILLTGTIQGALNNTGNITAGSIGLNIDGQVDGGITNSGNIFGSAIGIELDIPTAGHTITQTAGSVVSPNTALHLVNGFTDTFIGQGGFVEGNILADGFDEFSQSGAGTFAYVAGTATGIYHFDINGTGTFVLGSAARGVDGAGVNVTANHMYFNSGAGSAYLDDNTVVTLGDNFFADSASVTEFFLTTNTAQHGQINATNAITLAGTLAAYLDPLTFAATPLATGVTLTYTDVMTGGSRAGTFDNVGSILVTSSPFFTGNIVYDGTTVDIELQRLSFGDVLIAESHNQQAVGNALETIYSAGGYSVDLEDVFAALFDAATTAEVQAMLIELSGSQHAQVGQAVHNLTNSINGMVRERLDGVVLSQDGVRWAGTPGQRYAQAAAVASDAASSTGLRGSQGMTRGASGWSAWGRAFENEINVDSDADASGYDHDSQGGIVGVDYATSPNTTVGASVAYATSDMWFDATPDTADIESWQVNLFGSHGYGRFYVDGQATYAQHDIGTLRSIDLPAPAGTALATASYEASSWSVNGELGAIWRLGRVNMQPSVAVAYVDTSADGFTETSTAGYALNVSGADGESLSTTLALRASGQWMMAKTPVVPDFKIGWRHEYMDDVSSFGASFIDDPSVAMSIVSSKIQADSLVISSGATFGVTKNFEIFFDVNGQYNADASATNASGGLRVTW